MYVQVASKLGNWNHKSYWVQQHVDMIEYEVGQTDFCTVDGYLWILHGAVEGDDSCVIERRGLSTDLKGMEYV